MFEHLPRHKSLKPHIVNIEERVSKTVFGKVSWDYFSLRRNKIFPFAKCRRLNKFGKFWILFSIFLSPGLIWLVALPLLPPNLSIDRDPKQKPPIPDPIKSLAYFRAGAPTPLSGRRRVLLGTLISKGLVLDCVRTTRDKIRKCCDCMRSLTLILHKLKLACNVIKFYINI